MTKLEPLTSGPAPSRSPLQSIADAVARHYKDQFGRGPQRCRAHVAGRDAILVILEGTMSPAERRLADLGEVERVRGARAALQRAVQDEMLDAVRAVAGRGVEFSVPGLEVDRDVATELFVLTPEPDDPGVSGQGPAG